MKNTNSQRGMKKWQPFNALEHYDEYLDVIYHEKEKKDKPSLSEEQINDINYALSIYNHNEVNIHYFKQGEILQITGIINKIDTPNQVLTIKKIRIFFSNLLKIEFIN